MELEPNWAKLLNSDSRKRKHIPTWWPNAKIYTSDSFQIESDWTDKFQKYGSFMLYNFHNDLQCNHKVPKHESLANLKQSWKYS